MLHPLPHGHLDLAVKCLTEEEKKIDLHIPTKNFDRIHSSYQACVNSICNTFSFVFFFFIFVTAEGISLFLALWIDEVI